MNMEEAIQWLLKKQGARGTGVTFVKATAKNFLSFTEVAITEPTDDPMGKTNKKAIRASVDEDIRRWRERTEKQRLEEVRKEARAAQLAKLAEAQALAKQAEAQAKAEATRNRLTASGAIVPLNNSGEWGNSWTVPLSLQVQRSVLISEEEYESMKRRLKTLEASDSGRIGEESMKSIEHKFTSTRKFKFKGG